MLRKPLTPIDDDTEEAPWMVMGTPQYDAVAALYTSLRHELRSRGAGLFVAAMLPIRYRPIPGERTEQLAPDLLVAPVADHPRSSYDMEREGVPPSFVLEVISPESRSRDLGIKLERYEVMGVGEYALFAPRTADGRQLLWPALQGYRLDPLTGEYVAWEADEQGRLWSEVLELWLVVRDDELRLQRPDGSWLLTLEEEAQARAEEVRARATAEAELERLRAMIEKHSG
jgi:Putative restriction endonuclease